MRIGDKEWGGNYLQFEDGEVMLYISDSEGKIFSHQYNGVSCSQFGGRGKFVKLFTTTNKYFNPNWWHSLTHKLDYETGKAFVIPNFKYSRDFTAAAIKSDEKILKDHPNKIYQSVLKIKLEKRLNQLATKNGCKLKDFKILDEFITEALLKVSYLDKGKTKKGYIVWSNCD